MNQAYIVTGKVEEQFATVTLTVTELHLLSIRNVESEFEPAQDLAG